MDAGAEAEDHPRPGLGVIASRWTRLGVVGFGGPPAHIALLRRMCVRERRWIAADEFEDAIAACNLLPGPASTQLSIYCARRVGGGTLAGLVGGLCFVLPGLLLIIALAALFLADSPPEVVLAAGAGAGAVVAAVAVAAGVDLIPSSLARATGPPARVRWASYVVLGAVATILVGAWVVLVLIGCGLVELAARAATPRPGGRLGAVVVPLASVAGPTAGLAALSWTAFKVGALSYGGGFVIIPLMQGDAVDRHGWMTESEFLNAVALGQVTPGPVVHTVSVVGYAAAGVGGALLAAAVAFAPSFLLVLVGFRHFDALRRSRAAQAFLAGAGPAAIGASLGVAVPLAMGIEEVWQWVVLGAGAAALLVARRGVVPVLLCAALAGVVVGLAGGPVPG
jgi:chromate transporter